MAPAVACAETRTSSPCCSRSLQVGALALGDGGAENEPGDRKHEHQDLELVEIVGAEPNVRGGHEKCRLGREQRERHPDIARPHADPDDRQEQQIEQMVGVCAARAVENANTRHEPTMNTDQSSVSSLRQTQRGLRPNREHRRRGREDRDDPDRVADPEMAQRGRKLIGGQRTGR